MFALMAGLVFTLAHAFDQCSHERAVDDVRLFMDEFADAGGAGAVIIAHNGKPLLAEGFGEANREKGIPFTTKTIAQIGSLSKQFTATAALLLVSRGKMRLDDKVGMLIPEARGAVREVRRASSRCNWLSWARWQVWRHGRNVADGRARREDEVLNKWLTPPNQSSRLELTTARFEYTLATLFPERYFITTAAKLHDSAEQQGDTA